MNEKLRDYFLSWNFSFCLIFAKDNIIADDRITNIIIKDIKTGILQTSEINILIPIKKSNNTNAGFK